MKSYNCSAQIYLQKQGSFAYDVSAVQVTYSVNGVPMANVDLSVGSNDRGPIDLNFKKGDRVSIKVSSQAAVDGNPHAHNGVFTLLTGTVYDIGPTNVSRGAFSVRVIMFGRLSWLNSGTLECSSIISKGYQDLSLIGGPLIPDLQTYVIDPERLQNNGAFSELQRVFTEIATNQLALKDSVTEFIVKAFGAGINQNAAQILASMTSDVDGLEIKDFKDVDGISVRTPVVYGMSETMNSVLTGDPESGSFLNKMLAIGNLMNFVVVETGSRIRVVPSIPFINRGNTKHITSADYSQLSNQIESEGGVNNYIGAVLVAGDGRVGVGYDAAGLVCGLYKRGAVPGEFTLTNPETGGQTVLGLQNSEQGNASQGIVLVLQPPPILTAIMSTDAIVDMRDARNFTAAFSKETGDSLARLLCWLKMYQPQTYTVTCPYLRTDIAPATHVQVDFPDIPEIEAGVGTPAIYGYVQNVTISIDATAQQASTSYTVTYARSYREQVDEIDVLYDGHPIFTQNWAGSDLIDGDQVEGRDGFTYR